MTWKFNEIVRSGNSQARVKNYYAANGLIILIDIKGRIGVGSTIVGDDSGTVLTLTNFEIADKYDSDFNPTYWEDLLFNGQSILDSVVYDEGEEGNWLALDEHFTGTPSEDYQIDYLVVVD